MEQRVAENDSVNNYDDSFRERDAKLGRFSADHNRGIPPGFEPSTEMA